MTEYLSHDGKRIRLTATQKSHIVFFHPEIFQQKDEDRFGITLREPDMIVNGATIDTRISYKFFNVTPVTSKFLAVVVKTLDGEGFIITAYFTDDVKRSKVIWRKPS